MTKLERALEHVITKWGAAAIVNMNADSWWRRALGLLLALSALCVVIFILVLWLVFGKKPRR